MAYYGQGQGEGPWGVETQSQHAGSPPSSFMVLDIHRNHNAYYGRGGGGGGGESTITTH